MSDESRDYSVYIVAAALILGVIVAAYLFGCAPHPLPGAGEWDLVEAYGKPTRHYAEGAEVVMEWDYEGDWIRRSYFAMVNESNEKTGAIRFSWRLRETISNKAHHFYRSR